MFPDDALRQLHIRATQGEKLSAEEQRRLEAWYAQRDKEERTVLASKGQPTLDATMLRAQIDNALNQLIVATQHLEALVDENEKLRREVSALQQRLGESEINDIRQAYPLMDAVARAEGWDDPEMDSYNIYARKPQP